MNYIKYIDLVLDKDQKEKISSNQNSLNDKQSSIKTILANVSKRVQIPIKKDVISTTLNAPIVSDEILKKSEAARQSSTTPSNKVTEASPAFSIFAELSLRKAGKFFFNSFLHFFHSQIVFNELFN